MKEVQCPKCGKIEPHRENSMQLCWKCGGLHMVLVRLPTPTYSAVKAIMQNTERSVEDEK